METIIFISQQSSAITRKFGALFWLSVRYVKGPHQAFFIHYMKSDNTYLLLRVFFVLILRRMLMG